MKNEFREAYTNLFDNSFTNLRRIIMVKLKAIRYSNKFLMCGHNNGQPSFRTFGKMSGKYLDGNNMSTRFKFEPIDQNEIEDCSSDFCSSSS